MSEREIEFTEPLRVRARFARGSDLLHRRTLRQLLTGSMAARQPDLHVVLVDQNGELKRRTRLNSWVKDLLLPELVIGVANKEFETWLVADGKAVSECVGEDFSIPGKLESLDPRVAKNRLRGLIRNSPRESEESILRREIAERLDLDITATRCRSFRRFREDLRSATAQQSN